MTTKTTVIKIVAEHLLANGFGGLLACDAECGCELDDLVPCNSDFSQCEPAYKHADPRPENKEGWAMWRRKEAPTAEQWDGVHY